MHRRWSVVLTSLIATAAVITGASIVGGEARAGSSDEYVAPALLECAEPIVVSTTGPTDAESMGGLRFGYGQDMVLTHTLAVDLPAGTYEVEASTHDSYSFRADVVAQANEQVRIVATAGGDELAATGFTSDLVDGSFTGWAVSDLGSITLDGDADAITIEHYAVDHATVGPDSLKVAALCFRSVEPTGADDDGADDDGAEDERADEDSADEDSADETVDDGEAEEPCPSPEVESGSDDEMAGEDGAASAPDVAGPSDDCDEASSDAPCPGDEEPIEGGADDVTAGDVTAGDATDGDAADDDAVEDDLAEDEACDVADEPTADEPDVDEPAAEEPVDEDCIVVDEGDDTDFSGTEDCDDVILVEPCTDEAVTPDGDATDDSCDEVTDEEAADDGDTTDDGADDGTPEVDAGDSDDSDADDSDTDDSDGDDPDGDDAAGDDSTSDDATTDDATTDDATSDDATSDDATSDDGASDEPPAGPTAPADADDPEIPLVDTVPDTSDDEADPVQGAVDQQTPGQQGDLPITGATSGILVMLGLSLAIAGFALMGMVGRQYMGGAD